VSLTHGFSAKTEYIKTFTVPYKFPARNPEKALIIVDVFTVPLHSTGYGADHMEYKSRDSYLTSPLAPWFFPNNKL
jgi:hypothetical protein